MKILLVEDDAQLGVLVKQAVEDAGYTVDWVTRGDEAVEMATAYDYGTVLLDMSLPGLPGIDVLQALRKRGNGARVIIVTAQDRPTHRIAGLDAGADDYIVKPFDLAELLARVRAQARRHDGRLSDMLEVRGVELDLGGRTVNRGGERVMLTAKEYKITSLLMRRAGRFVTKAELEDALYDDSKEVESNTVEVGISAIRRKIGSDFIVTVRGLGYTVPT